MATQQRMATQQPGKPAEHTPQQPEPLVNPPVELPPETPDEKPVQEPEEAPHHQPEEYPVEEPVEIPAGEPTELPPMDSPDELNG